VSSTCFDNSIVHPQEDLYMEFYGVSFIAVWSPALSSTRLLIWIQWKKYHKTACTSLPEDEHLDVRNMSKTL